MSEEAGFKAVGHIQKNTTELLPTAIELELKPSE